MNTTQNQTTLATIMGALNNKTGGLDKPAGRTEYERRPGTGALFGTVDQTTGEIVITGSFRAPEGGMELSLVGKLGDEGKIILTGDVIGHENMPFQVAGELKPQSYDADYKGGFIAVIGPKAKFIWNVNSKSATSKTSDKPYRFVWFTRGATVAI